MKKYIIFKKMVTTKKKVKMENIKTELKTR